MEEENLNELLILIDDVFPKDLSSFRNVEFSGYISKFENVLLINISKYSFEEKDFNQISKHKNVQFYQTNFEDGNILKINELLKKYKVKKSSIVFLNNVYGYNGKVLEFLEKNKIKFIFTLYPGGGFFLNDDTTKKLKRIFTSPMFFKVITTQRKTYDYLISNKLCKENQMEYIYGLPTSKSLLNISTYDKRHYGIKGKINLNICFVAFKYSSEGKDKGYDIFIEVAKKLRRQCNDIYFHVVGNFDENDIDVSELDERIAFYGVQPSDWFVNFYKDKDIIISPTRPNILSKGAFDGFPTGASSDAMLNEVLVMATDPLDLNTMYKNNEDLIIINHNEDEIVNKVIELKNNPQKMYKIAKNGYKKANNIYSYKNQIDKRISLIEEMSEINE